MSVTELDRVREVLLGSEYDELLKLRGDYQDDARFATHVAAVLTEAIEQRTLRDDSIAHACRRLVCIVSNI